MSARPDRARVKGVALLALVALLAALVLSACGGGDSTSSEATSESAATESEGEAETTGAENEGETETTAADGEAWCGPEGVKLGIQDGEGLDAWSHESLEQVQIVSKACPSVEEEIIVKAGLEPQKAVSGIQSMISRGVNAIVIIPDSGNCAEVPAMRQAMQRDIVVVPWAANPVAPKAPTTPNTSTGTPKRRAANGLNS